MPATIQSRALSFDWPSAPGVRDISLAFARGEVAAFVGPNGAGKSTLLRLLTGFLKPAAGEVLWNGRPAREWRRPEAARFLTLVPQYSVVNAPLTVNDFVTLGRYARTGPWAGVAARDREAVATAMARTDVTQLGARAVSGLSGGEFQRAVIARALAQEPEVLLLDEPTAHLDISHQARVFELLTRLNAERGLTVIAAVHDLNLAALFPRVILLAEGRLAADGPPGSVFDEALLSGVYGCRVRIWEVAGRRFIFPEMKGGRHE